MTITEELKGAMSISDPYVVNAQVIVTKDANAEKYATAADLKDATVAVEGGSAGEKEAIAAGLNTVAVAAQSDALKEVKAGTADACIIDITMAKAMTGEGTSYEGLTYTGSLSEEFYGIGFRKNSDLAPEVAKIIEELKADGSLDALAKKYNLTLAD
jgi:polar amino acid transport system substrate-binding protein